MFNYTDWYRFLFAIFLLTLHTLHCSFVVTWLDCRYQQGIYLFWNDSRHQVDCFLEELLRNHKPQSAEVEAPSKRIHLEEKVADVVCKPDLYQFYPEKIFKQAWAASSGDKDVLDHRCQIVQHFHRAGSHRLSHVDLLSWLEIFLVLLVVSEDENKAQDERSDVAKHN